MEKARTSQSPSVHSQIHTFNSHALCVCACRNVLSSRSILVSLFRRKISHAILLSYYNSLSRSALGTEGLFGYFCKISYFYNFLTSDSRGSLLFYLRLFRRFVSLTFQSHVAYLWLRQQIVLCVDSLGTFSEHENRSPRLYWIPAIIEIYKLSSTSQMETKF